MSFFPLQLFSPPTCDSFFISHMGSLTPVTGISRSTVCWCLTGDGGLKPSQEYVYTCQISIFPNPQESRERNHLNSDVLVVSLKQDATEM